MYSRKEQTRIREEFWTSFGRHLALSFSASGEKPNWINYKTGHRHIAFKMDASQHEATIAIQIRHPEPSERINLYKRLYALKTVLEAHTNEKWEWREESSNEQGISVSSVTKSVAGLNVLNRDHWVEIGSFLKPRIIALDIFWNEVKEIFDVY